MIGYEKKILLVFWNNNNNNNNSNNNNNNNISKLCENWAFYRDNQVYTRFEELFTFSGEALYTREHKATLTKKKHMYVDIDEMKVYIDLSFKKEDIIFKNKKEFIDMLDKVNNKTNNITNIKTEIIKIKDKVSKNIQSIFDKIFIKLPDDPQLRLA